MSSGMGSKKGSHLDLTGAEISQPIQEESKGREAPTIKLPHQDAEYISHIAIDIGGSLIKLVYFMPDNLGTKPKPATKNTGGTLHFARFETHKIEEALLFIKANCLVSNARSADPAETRQPTTVRIKATGGGAFKFADIFQERLGILLEKEDEMDCAVSGCNFFLKAVRFEAFTFVNFEPDFTPEKGPLFPYLLVNIGSGISIIRVEGDGKFDRVSGSSLGGGTFWGLCRLLTGCRNFDEMLELSARGDNAKVDMLVGDIYGDRDYSSIGLSATTIASSFGKVVSNDLGLEDLEKADMAMALCRMVSYNIAHLAFLVAMQYELPRIIFGGFFIRGHRYTMDTISFAIKFFSKGKLSARFLRHEGYLGALGAFLKAYPIPSASTPGNGSAQTQTKVQARFVEKFSSMGSGTEPSLLRRQSYRGGVEENVDWVEKFLRAGAPGMEIAQDESNRIQDFSIDDDAHSADDTTPLQTSQNSVDLHVGVLHYSPGQECFPLLKDPAAYTPDTSDLNNAEQRDYWIQVLKDQLPTVVEKAISTDGSTPEAKRRASAFRRAFLAQLSTLQESITTFGKIGLGELFEMREECLRDFGFADVYRSDKERENAAALEVFHDLLKELDALSSEGRLLALIQGSLAANIFDWGARACVELYHQGTILEIYRKARTKLSKRPWRVDDFDEFSRDMFTSADSESKTPTFKRVVIFVDNAGADIVLGMLPLAREMLKMGSEVVLCANSLPAINDITVQELKDLVDTVGKICPIIQDARRAALAEEEKWQGNMPPLPGLKQRTVSISRNLSDLSSALDQRRLSNDIMSSPSSSLNRPEPHSPADTTASGLPPNPKSNASDFKKGGSPPRPTLASCTGSPVRPEEPSLRQARLYIISNGQGSPCLDLRRVPGQLADATVGADLVILEGMGRAVLTNLRAQLKCPVLKLAMIKTRYLAEQLFHGEIYDCVCIYDRPHSQPRQFPASPPADSPF